MPRKLYHWFLIAVCMTCINQWLFSFLYVESMWAVIAQSIYRLATGWAVRRSNPGWGGGEIFRSRPDRPSGPPSLLYNDYRLFLGVVKRPGCGVDHPPPSDAAVIERVELYPYSTSGPPWPVVGWTLSLTLLCKKYSQLIPLLLSVTWVK